MARLQSTCETVCPFIDRNDARCDHRFSLSRLEQAFHVCLDDHRSCPTYVQLAREQQREHSLTVHITVEGQVPPAYQRRAIAV